MTKYNLSYIFHLTFQQSPWLNNLIFVIIFRNFHDFGGKNIELINIHRYANEATC